MPKVTKSVLISRPPQEVFDYLAAFETTSEWDPGIVEATRTSDGPLGVGSTFDLVSNFLGRKIPVSYEMTEYEPPRRFVIVGRNPRFIGIDEIIFTPEGAGTRVDYTADFRMQGIAKLFEPLMGGMFQKLSDAAIEGMKRTLG